MKTTDKTSDKNIQKRERTALTLRQCVNQIKISQKRNTIGVTKALLYNLNMYAGRQVNVEDMTEKFVENFTIYLLTKVKPSSAKTYLQKLHSIMEHAVELKYADNNPIPRAMNMIPRCESCPRSFLTVEEIHTMIVTPCENENVRLAFLFACFTGLRLSDIETLSWGDIQTIGGTPTIVKNQIKTGHVIRIPLNREALTFLEPKHVNMSIGNVFLLPSRTIIAKVLHKWATASGIEKHVTFHTSRHTFATLAITAGVEIYTVSKLCGHRSVRTTEIYTHIIDSTLREGVNRISKLLSHSASN